MRNFKELAGLPRTAIDTLGSYQGFGHASGTLLTRLHRTLLCLAVLELAPGRDALAAEALTSRQEFQEAYIKQQRNSPSLFDTVPVYQIVPVENTITFALAGDYKDVTVAPGGKDISSRRQGLTERLDLKGWSASPYVALSTKHFGFGFTGELGKMNAHYKRDASMAFNEQQGTANYSGIGAYLYLSPGWKFVPKNTTVNFVAGGKSLNVQHENSGANYSPAQTVQMTKYRYAVHNFDAGINLGIRFVKRFTVIPWVDYSTNFATAPTQADPTASRSGPDGVDPALKDDIDLFWHAAPPLRYGLDFVVNMLGVDVHFGGLLGLLGNLNKGADRIQDNSRYVSVSFDIKG